MLMVGRSFNLDARGLLAIMLSHALWGKWGDNYPGTG